MHSAATRIDGTVAPLRLPRLLTVALILLPMLWAIGHLLPPLNHDAAALLAFSRRMLAGERLYADLIDLNPPMAFWLNLPALWLADVTGWSEPAMFQATVLAAVALSCWLGRTAATPLVPDTGPIVGVLVPSLTLFALLVLPAHSFGQRDHLVLVFALPYVVLTAGRLQGERYATRLALAIGAFAAIGLSLKPYFLVLPVLLELLVLARRGWDQAWHPTPIAILLALIVYLGTVLIGMPEYLGFVVPLVQNHYQSLSMAALPALLVGDQIPMLVVGMVVCTLLARRAVPFAVLAPAVITVLAFTVSGLLQAKGWDYHFVSARGALAILVGLTLGALIERVIDHRRTSNGAPAAISAMVVALVWLMSGALSPPFAAQSRFATSVAGRLSEVIRIHAPGGHVLWLSSSIYPQYPALNHGGATSAMRWMSLWLLPALYGRDTPVDGRLVPNPPEAMGLAENLLFRSIGDDLVRRQPALIIVQDATREGGFQGKAFDYLDYFRRNPRFAAEWRQYRPLVEIDGIRVYRRN